MNHFILPELDEGQRHAEPHRGTQRHSALTAASPPASPAAVNMKRRSIGEGKEAA